MERASRLGPALPLFLALVVGGGLAIGYFTAPGEWFAQLEKPGFNPPGWVFGPVWTVLYVLIAIAGWRVWGRDSAGRPMRLWWAQLALNFLWSPVFFAAHLIGPALAIVFLLLAVVSAFVAAAWPQDRGTALLFVPYAAWGGLRRGAQRIHSRPELRAAAAIRLVIPGLAR